MAHEKGAKPKVTPKIVWILFCLISFSYLHFFYDGTVSKVFGITKWLFIYAAIIVFLSFFSKYKAGYVIYAIVSIPATIMMKTAPVVHVLASFAFVYIIVFGMIFILVYSSQNVFNYQMNFTAGIYLILTLTAIVTTSFADRLIKWWNYAQDKKYKNRVINLSIKLFGQKKVRLFIFLIYFFLLIIFTFSSLNNIILVKIDKIDIAILQSFATYVAFDRIISNWPNIKSEIV
jgi:hypothetical protein